MAESSEVHPSLEGIFHILAQVPEERLTGYKHKLSCERQDQRSSQLLQTMILLTLKRETEARRNLDALRGDPVAARISHYSNATANTTNVVVPLQQQQEEAEVRLAIARIYSLLVDAKWCGCAPRDEAYRAAIAAFRSSGIGEDWLRSLTDEALEKCGMGFTFGSRETGKTPRASDPVPVPNSLDPQPLRSTGSPTSLVSHLEISQSLTVPVRTHSVQYSTGISKLCGDIQHVEERNRDESLVGREEKYEESSDLKNSRCSSFNPSVSRVSPERSVQCPEPAAEKQVPPKSLPHDPQILSADSEHPQRSVANSSSSKPSSNTVSGPPLAVPSPMDPQVEDEFFTFVVVHAGEDEAIACRVKAQLESMGVSNGATYSEDFLVPGRCQLDCFENALDNSAYTLFLLTENFNSRLCAYKTNVALIDSFNRKANTVIPFIPKERPLKPEQMPLLLAGLVPMDENSPVFPKRVKNTFREKDIQNKKAAWSRRRQIQEKERLQEQNREYQQLMQRLSVFGMNMPYVATSPQGFSGHAPQQCFYPSLGMSQLPQGPDLPSLGPSFKFSQGFGGAQPSLIIQNAQMVQIGDCNNMQVERTNATLGTAEENGAVNP
ncbi:TIR domain-containing adapter molecule 1 [Anolis sagrei]|uniref:TIR domain-containing adapter molecule 1 n=1 Tax=Anolis sagrei TaxID=38937 RepID=UPI0035214A03